jgi:hypothetical protein
VRTSAFMGARIMPRVRPEARNDHAFDLLVTSDLAASFFDPGAVPLAGDETPFQAAWTGAGLAADFFAFVLDFELGGLKGGLQALAELLAGDQAILRLGTLALAAPPRCRSGMCRSTTVELVLLTFWPPAPEPRMNDSSRSSSREAEFLHAGAQGAVVRQVGHGARER